MGRLVTFAVAVLAAGVLIARWADRGVPIRSSPSAMAAAPADSPTGASNSRTVSLSPGNDGHFRAQARVDGRVLELVVDTGASTVALRASDAARLGIHPTPHDYNVKVATANGMTRAALVQLGMVEIGNIVVRHMAVAKNAFCSMGFASDKCAVAQFQTSAARFWKSGLCFA
jgi:aspartyl protease family protein